MMDDDTFKSRPYQDEILDVCIKKNTIIYLPTGAGKTYIAIMAIKHFAKDLMRSFANGGKRSVFVVNTIVLARQQAEMLKQTTSFIVKCFTGDMNVDEWKREKWREEFEKAHVIVATCQIIVDIIRHSFMSISDFNVVVFDECHHGRKDHPMHQLMAQFENIPKYDQPRIIGLTGMLISASIKPEQVSDELRVLETVFQSTISTIGSYDDFCNVLVYSTNPVERNLLYSDDEPTAEIEDIVNQIRNCIDKIYRWNVNDKVKQCPKTLNKVLPSKLKYVVTLLKDFEYQLLDMGTYGASLAILSVTVDIELKKRDLEEANIRDMYRMVITVCECIRHKLVMRMGLLPDITYFSTDKVKKFLSYLSKHVSTASNKNLKCIVFVNRRYTAKNLYHIIKRYDPNLKTDFIVGVNNEINESVDAILSSKSNRKVLEKFKKNETNIIVASSVLEEGIDLQSCNLVIQYDAPTTFRSYVQSRGRARSKTSEYIIMLSHKEEIKFLSKLAMYKRIEEEVKLFLIGKTINRQLPNDDEIQKELYDHIIPPYFTKMNAEINALSAINILNRYVQTLPKDSYTETVLTWERKECEDNKIIVKVFLPVQAAIKEPIVSDPYDNLKMAKRSAAFKACVRLHQSGNLSDSLLPVDPIKKVENLRTTYFTHWEDYKDDNVKKAGTKKNKRPHVIEYPKEFENCTPQPESVCYLYFIKIVPKFVKTDALGIQETYFKLYNTSNSFGIITTKKLPLELATMTFFITIGQLDVEILTTPTEIPSLSEQDINYLKNFHRMVFRDILKMKKDFYINDNSNTTNSYTIVPTANYTNIDWSIVKQFQKLSEPRELSELERINLKFIPEKYLYNIINPWYRFDSERNYLVTHVLEHLTPMSPFPNIQYENYASYYEDKYSNRVVNPNQFLIQVSGISKQFNRLIPGIDEMGRSKKIAERNLQEIYIPELCHNYTFPGDIWLKAILLPSILHRLHNLLLVEAIRCDMSKYLNVHIASRQHPQLPLDVHVPDQKFNKTLLNSIVDGYDDADRDDDDSTEDECDDLVLKTHSIVIPNPENVTPKIITTQIESYFDIAENRLTNLNLCDIDRDIDGIHAIDLDHLITLARKIKDVLQMKSNNDVVTDVNSYLLNADTSFVTRAICDTEKNEKMNIKILNLNVEAGRTVFQQSDLMKALTTISSCDVFDQERFETLGDAFLKFSISFYLFKIHPDWHEGHLTTIKGQIVSNRNLFYCGAKYNLGGIIKQYNFKPEIDWMPPLFTIPKCLQEHMTTNNLSASLLHNVHFDDAEVNNNKEVTLNRLNEITQSFDQLKSTSTFNNTTRLQSLIKQQFCNDKTIADTVEALIGVSINTIGVERSFNCLTYFKLIPNSVGDLRHIMGEYIQCDCLKPDARLEEIDAFLINYQYIEQKLGYKFKDRAYLLQALTHSSFAKNRLTDCYQKLEFLGDSVLDFLITSYIFERCGDLDPGKLTDLRSALVNNTTLACISVRNKFHLHLLSNSPSLSAATRKFVQYQNKMHHKITDQVYLLVNETENIENNVAKNAILAHFIDVPKALGDIFESLIGAIFLDSNNNLKVVWEVIYNLMANELNEFMINVPIQIVRRLYEYPGALPKFSEPVVNNDVVMVTLRFTMKNEILSVSGFGQNKEDAKRAAAKIALQKLHESD